MALALHNVAELAESDRLLVEIDGEGAASLPRDERNVVVRGARLVYEAAGRTFRGLAVRQRNGIPPGRGLGSSGSAWLAGILGANALLGDPLDRDGVMDLAVRQEGHPDNLGASLHGGLTATCWDAETRAVVALPVPDAVEFAVLIPAFEASTEAARAELPASYPRPTPSTTWGGWRSSWRLVDAGLGGTWWVRRWAIGCTSRTAPGPCSPGSTVLLAAARRAGALGAALSGAGPSVLGVTAAGQGAVVAAPLAQGSPRRVTRAAGTFCAPITGARTSSGCRTEHFFRSPRPWCSLLSSR